MKATRTIHLKVVDRFADGTTREAVDVCMNEEIQSAVQKEKWLWNGFVRLSAMLDKAK